MIEFTCVACNEPTCKVRLRGSLDTCRKCVKKQITQTWKQKYSERKLELNRRWTANNLEKDRAMKKKWQDANLEYGRAKTAKYYTKKKNAVPPWADLEKIKDIYLHCPVGHHVDHIVPLQGKIVSGLHVETNLQYLPAFDNRSKSNHFEGNP